MLTILSRTLLGLIDAADGGPELGAVVQVEGGDGAGLAGGLHAFDDEFGGGGGERGEDAAGVEPADASGEDLGQSKSPGLSRAPASLARL